MTRDTACKELEYAYVALQDATLAMQAGAARIHQHRDDSACIELRQAEDYLQQAIVYVTRAKEAARQGFEEVVMDPNKMTVDELAAASGHNPLMQGAIWTKARRLEAENVRLREKLVEERTDLLWQAYNTGHEEGGKWGHSFMSDGEWLAGECGLDPRRGVYSAEEVKAAIPKAALRVLEEDS